MCQRVDDIFFLEKWVENGYSVEFWDLSDITFHEKLSPIHVDGVKELKFSTRKDFKEAVKNNSSGSVFMMWFGCYNKTAFIFRNISQYKGKICVISNGLLPTISYPKGKITLLYIINVLKEKATRLCERTSLYRPASFVFFTASQSAPQYKTSKETVFAKCNSGDYESLIRNKKTEVVKGDYFLFLDQYIPYHNDYKLSGCDQLSDIKYYDALNSFFSGLEKRYGIPVVIAAHPSATKYKTKNLFQERGIFFNKTMALTPRCRAIIAHYTTALSAAVVYNKPVFLLTSDDFISLRPSQNAYIEAFSRELGSTIINMDHTDATSFDFREINSQKYKEYKYKYLTNQETENRNNFENISKIINR